jgi:hypothetical protein
MDEGAFLRLDLAEVAKDGSLDNNTLEGIAVIRRGLFNPEDVGAEAKRKLLFESIVEVVKKFKSEPSDDFIRFVLGRTEMGSKLNKLTQKIVDGNREIVRAAMEAFVAQEALARFGYAPKDVVRTASEQQETPVVAATASLSEPEPVTLAPSEKEASAFAYVKNRLFYLVRTDVLFAEVNKISFRKSKNSFRVYYMRPNNGSLFDFREHKDGQSTLQFPVLDGKEIIYANSSELDEYLLKAFTKRVSESGVTSDASPALRAIQGGQGN